MGNLVADAMRAKYPGVDAAITNSGGLREDLLIARAVGGEQPGEITWGEAFAVLPFGNCTVVETLTYAQLVAAFENGFKPPCGDVAGGTGRTPQFSGLKVTFHCNGAVPVMDSILRGTSTTPLGAERHDPDRHQRLHVHGWRRLHGVRGRHGRRCSPATRCWTC